MPNTIPYMIESQSCDNLSVWIEGNKSLLHYHLNHEGALLLRGFDITTEKHFESMVNLCCNQVLEYTYRSTPRTDLGNGIYTATEYPAGLPIPLHNENSYQRDWPLLILFCCLRPADNKAGQTPLADTLRVTAQLEPQLVKLFEEKQVMYIRNYYDHVDIPWQVVFQTNSRDEVIAYCKLHGIAVHWRPNGTLQTQQVCQSFAYHPISGERLWFNQAHLFHPSSLDVGTRSLMAEMYREDEFPRNVTFGDGSAIEENMLASVRDAFEQAKVTFEWRKGDVLILDNMRIAHGRTPYRGERRVIVAMGDPVSSYSRV